MPFGSFIKIQLNLDLFVQPALFLLLNFLSGQVLSPKLCFLQSMAFGCLNSKRQMFLVLVVEFSMTTGVVEVINKASPLM